jgi:hypothetical protein
MLSHVSQWAASAAAHSTYWGYRAVEATIVQIMESWPLQLVLQTPAGREQVVLAENIRIERAGVLVDPGVLQPGQRVRVLMRTPRGEIAELEILD